MDTEIRTARLFMRRSHPTDLEAMHALVSDYEVVKMTATWPWPADRDFTMTRCQPLASELGMAGPVFAGDQMVGLMGVADTGDGPSMGYNFGRDHWGQGFATEMGQALIRHVFQTYDWPHIGACVFTDNPVSARVLEKLGFTQSGACAGPCAARGTSLPMRNFGLTRPKP